MNDFALKILTAPLGKTHLFFAGQAGFIIKSACGKLLAIDLYLSECVERVEGHMGFKRLLPCILNPNELQFDYVIATHPHMDHFDMDSIPIFMSCKKTKLFVSLNCRQYIENAYIDESRVAYITPGDVKITEDFGISFVSCDHGSGAPDAVGVVVAVDGKKIYEAGDTCLRLDRIDEYKEKGPFDVLIAPINGAYGNLNEEECAVLSAKLNPRLTIPCHYGMFASHGGNPGIFLEKMKEICPYNAPYLMAAGEGIIL